MSSRLPPVDIQYVPMFNVEDFSGATEAGTGTNNGENIIKPREIIYVEHYLYFSEIMTFSFHENIFKVATLSQTTTENEALIVPYFF